MLFPRSWRPIWLLYSISLQASPELEAGSSSSYLKCDWWSLRPVPSVLLWIYSPTVLGQKEIWGPVCSILKMTGTWYKTKIVRRGHA